MPSYKEMYFHLFNAMTDALREIEARDDTGAAKTLIAAQQWGEERYLELPDSETITE